MTKFSLSNLLKLDPLTKSANQIHFVGSATRKSLYPPHNSENLYRRISPLGDPNVSVVPVLDQWIKEGRNVSGDELRRVVSELRAFKRCTHALEVSQWMTDKRYIPLAPRDVAIRMNLMFEVHGVKEVENYFDSVHQDLKDYHVHFALLNCYVHSKSIEKAEAVMQKAREKGYNRTPLPYNIMMNLYYSTGNWKKLDDLMNEMEEKGILFDQFTLTIRLSAYATASDVEGVDKIVKLMESTLPNGLDFSSCVIAAKGYLKVGQVKRGLAMLKKSEGLIITTKRRNLAFDSLLKSYAQTGKKEELYRVWTMYKQDGKFNNKGYITMMKSLLKFCDVEGIEKVFEDWESRGLSYDFKVLDVLISAYCRDGHLGKAEALLNKGLSEGGDPRPSTWYYMADGYIREFQFSKAAEALKKVISVIPPTHNPSKQTLTTCLGYLESKGDVGKAHEFISFVKAEEIFPGVDHDRLLYVMEHRESA